MAHGREDQVNYRAAEADDEEFIVEMARYASTIEDRPLPDQDSLEVVGVLPPSPNAIVIATDSSERRLGAAWWHWHDPPLVVDQDGRPVPELIVAVIPDARDRGIGAGLIEELARVASERFDTLALNVHLRNPAARLYTRAGFRVAGQGRGWFGVSMTRALDASN